MFQVGRRQPRNELLECRCADAPCRRKGFGIEILFRTLPALSFCRRKSRGELRCSMFTVLAGDHAGERNVVAVPGNDSTPRRRKRGRSVSTRGLAKR